MSVKDLFTKYQTKKSLLAADKEKLGEVESAGYVDSYQEDRERFEPTVDFSLPENFVRFGSAEKYYSDSINRILSDYPFDGSR